MNLAAAALCEGLSDSEIANVPDPAKWSIAENFAHLCVTARTFLPSVDRALEETRRRALFREDPYRLGWYGRLLVWYVEPPPAIRLPAPKMLRPLPVGDPSRALDDFLRMQAEVLRRIEASEGLDLTVFRFGLPRMSYARMNLLEYFSVYIGHTQRHLWQASNVKSLIAGASHPDVAALL